MAQVNAGRVRFISRGEYNNSTQYYLFDLVDYNGSSYFAKANTTGNVPTNTTYWQLVAEKGNTGGDGPVGPTGNGIASIVKTASAGLIDTYTITFTNGSTTTFNVTNGQDGDVTQEYVDEENERLKSVFNVLPKVSDSGESVTLNDTGDTMLYKVDLKGNTSQEVISGETGDEVNDTSIYVDDVNEDKENYITLKGNTYQYSTSGKNLFNPSYAVYYCSVSGNEITLSGETDFYINGSYSYSMSTIFEIPQGNYRCITTNSNVRATVYGIYDGETTVRGVDSNTTTPFNTTSTLYVKGIRVRSVNGNSLNGTKVKIYLGTGSKYEEYTGGIASPNPDYPQDIQVVSGDNTIKVEGKNLFNLNDLVKGRLDNGVIGYADGTDSITVNGNNFTIVTNTNWRGASTENYIILEPSKRYYLSFTSSVDTQIKLACYNQSKTFLSDIGYTTQSSGVYYFETPANTSYGRLQIQVKTAGTCTIQNMQIERNDTTSTTYEAYKGQTYPINLGSIELCKIGTYQDYFYKDSGKWYLKKEIGEVVLDGTQNWQYGTSGVTGIASSSFQKGDMLSGNYLDGLTTYFHNDKTGKTKNSVRFGANNKYIYLYLDETEYTSVNDVKTWLSTHNTTCYYVLATPTTTEITDPTLISQLNALYNATIYSTTHINTETSNLLPYIDLKYNVVTPAPSPDRASEVEVVKGNNTITISNEDGTKTQTYNLTLGNLELCKIGNYQDYFYKDNGNWYKYGAIGKTTDVVGSTSITINDMINNGGMYSLYGGTLSGKTITYDSALLRQNTIYYPLSTPTTTQITDQLLVSQLDELQKAMSYYDKTLITQTNAKKPFILDVIGIRDLRNIFNL